jgi:hypothetical protein
MVSNVMHNEHVGRVVGAVVQFWLRLELRGLEANLLATKASKAAVQLGPNAKRVVSVDDLRGLLGCSVRPKLYEPTILACDLCAMDGGTGWAHWNHGGGFRDI